MHANVGTLTITEIYFTFIERNSSRVRKQLEKNIKYKFKANTA